MRKKFEYVPWRATPAERMNKSRRHMRHFSTVISRGAHQKKKIKEPWNEECRLISVSSLAPLKFKSLGDVLLSHLCMKSKHRR